MKRRSVAAFGLLVVVCALVAAPAAQAGVERGVPGRLALWSPADWVGGLFDRVARWLDRINEEPRATTEAECDQGLGLDPTGAPCH